jgi:ribosome-associated protein
MNDSSPEQNRPSGQHADRTKPTDREKALGVSRSPASDGHSVNASPEAEEEARRFAIAAAKSLKDDKCEDILVLDLRGRSQVTDFFVIASGTSEVQMRAASREVMEVGEAHGFKAHTNNLREGDAEWFLIDFVDVVVHVFEPDTRIYYDLEMLWGDAPRLDWDGGGGESRNRANLRPDEKPSATDEEE